MYISSLQCRWISLCAVLGAMLWPAITSAQIAAAMGPPNKVELAVQSFLRDPQLKNASFGFYVIDLKTGKAVATYDPDRSLVPASTQKLVTTATALDMLGPNYRAKTLLEYDGYIDSMCVLQGNVYLKGGGDPALAGSTFKKRYEHLLLEWADAIQQLGVDSIAGAVIGDASIFDHDMIPATWIWGDMGNYYGAGPCGLTWRDNKVVHSFSSGPEKGDLTHVDCTFPYIPGYQVQNSVKAANNKRDLAFFYGAPYSDFRYVEGTIPANKEEFMVTGSMPDPALLAAWELEGKLWELGIPVGGKATTVRHLQMAGTYEKVERTEVDKIYSPALSSLVKQTNLYSVNLYAEHILNFVALKRYGRGSTTSGTNAVVDFWTKKGMDVEGFHPNDGSGLSRFNAVTARQLVFVLQYMKTKSKQYKTFYASLPVAGKSGTLKSIGRNTAASGRVHAKSGTMSRIKSYAGYVSTVNDKELAFAMVLNNCNCSGSEVKKKLEKLMVAMAQY